MNRFFFYKLKQKSCLNNQFFCRTLLRGYTNQMSNQITAIIRSDGLIYNVLYTSLKFALKIRAANAAMCHLGHTHVHVANMNFHQFVF